MIKKHLVVLSGAGVSADSGIQTFRDANGLWADHRIEDVCTPEALVRNPGVVLDFYNKRRRQLAEVEPNAGHYALARLEAHFLVDIITQNVDNLHERAGSSRVLHLHGELTKCRSMADPSYIVDIEGDIHIGDLCPKGGQLRPHIVFFGEPLPAFPLAEEIISTADIVVIAGTSLQVYPAASLVYYAPSGAEIYVVDPVVPAVNLNNVNYIIERSVSGLPKLYEMLVSKK